mgnify:CR=1 FL=1
MPSDKLLQQLFARGKQASKDFEEYLRFVFNIQVANHEKLWVKALQKTGDNSTKGELTIIIAPPGGGKTTLSIAFVSWMIGRTPNNHFGLFSYADRPAWDRSNAIRKLIETSKPYHFTFPTVKPDRKSWGTSVFRVERPNIGDPHPTLRAGGTRSAVVSYRLDGLLIDDAHDVKNITTSVQREKVYENYQQAILTRLVEGAWQVTIGTRWSEDDLIGRLIKRGGWKIIPTPALIETKNGLQSYWPEKYSLESLLDIKYKSPALFSVQYLGDTTGGETGIIKKIVTYDIDPLLFIDNQSSAYKDLLIGIGIDTSLKKSLGSDYNVLYVGGLDQYGRIWVLDRDKGHWGLPELIEHIKEMYYKWSPFQIWVEDSSSGTPAVDTLRSESPGIPIQTVSPRGSKDSRANTLSQYLQGAQVVLPKFAEWFPDSEHELSHYGYCFPYDESLLLANGRTVKCSELLKPEEEFEVLIPKGTRSGQRPARERIKAIDGGKDYIYTIKLESGMIIRRSGQHKLLCTNKRREKKFISCNNIQLGDKVVILNEFDFCKKQDRRLGRKWTDMALIIGMLLGDGCFTKQYKVSFGQENPIIRQLFIDTALKLGEYLSEGRGQIGIGSRIKRSGKHRLKNLPPSAIHRKLCFLNLFGKNAYTKELPEWTKYIDAKTAGQILRGLLLTDGWINKNGTLGIELRSKNLRDWTAFVAHRLGCPGSIHDYPNANYVWTAYREFVPALINRIGGLPGKKNCEKLNYIPKRYRRINKKTHWQKVVAVQQSTDMEPVVCISILNNNHQLCTPIIEHNSDHDDDMDALFILVGNLFNTYHPSFYEKRPEMILKMQ